MKNGIAKLFIILMLTAIIVTPVYFSLAEEEKSSTENGISAQSEEVASSGTRIASGSGETSFSAVLYDTSSYASGGTGTELLETGTEIDSWNYGASKYLQINTTVPSDGNTYVIQVKMPQEFYIVSNSLTAPTGFSSVEFTKNDDISVNNGSSTYSVNTYSGTAEFTIESGVETSTLQLQIAYDTVLWNKIANSLLTKDGVYPLEVLLCTKATEGTLNKVKDLYVSQATSGTSWSFGGLNFYTYLQNGSNTTTYQEISIMSDKTAIYTPFLYTSTQAHVYYYFEDLKLEITIPSYKDSSGNTHYLEADTSSLAIYNNPEFDVDTSSVETDHKIIVTIKDFYFYSNNKIFTTGITFSFPESLEGVTDVTSFTFSSGKITYNVADKTGTYNSIYSKNLSSIIYNTAAVEKVAVGNHTKTVTVSRIS